MNTLVMIGQFILSLSILIFVHELGHFLAAKFFKTRVEKFYLFFDFLFPMPNVLNFALFKKKIGETEYGLGWFPLGGYVSIAGMIDETKDASSLSSVPQPWEYNSKKGWQKLIIILGGIIFNLIFAFIIFSFILLYFEKQYLPTSELKDGGVLVSSKAYEYGFRDGDFILEVNGKKPKRFQDLVPTSVVFGGNYLVERKEGDKIVNKTIEVPSDMFRHLKNGLFTPFFSQVLVESVVAGGNAEKYGMMSGDIIQKVGDNKIMIFDQFKQLLDSNKSKMIDVEVLRNNKTQKLNILVGNDGKLGFISSNKNIIDKYKLKDYNLFESLGFGVEESWKLFTLQAVSIGKMFSGEVSVKENLGGPVAIARQFGTTWDWHKFWLFTAMISIGLAFMNLLPIPALDGGHAVLILFEMISGKKANEKVLTILQNIGTFLLLGLMAFAFFNDIMKIFNK